MFWWLLKTAVERAFCRNQKKQMLEKLRIELRSQAEKGVRMPYQNQACFFPFMTTSPELLEKLRIELRSQADAAAVFSGRSSNLYLSIYDHFP